MKCKNFLKVFLIMLVGVLFLNSVFAGITTKTFLIKGELTMTSNLITACSNGASTVNPADFDAGDDVQLKSKLVIEDNVLYFAALPLTNGCTLTIINPTGEPIYSKTNKSAEIIKTLLETGISFTANIDSTDQTLNFIIRISDSSNSSNILLETNVTVPNPNSAGTNISANEILSTSSTSGLTCDASNVNKIANNNGVLVKCSRDEISHYWANLSGEGGSSELNANTLRLMFMGDGPLFLFCPLAGCKNSLGIVQPGTEGKLYLMNDIIKNKHIENNSISYDKLTDDLKAQLISMQEVIDTIQSMIPEPDNFDAEAFANNLTISRNNLDAELTESVGRIIKDNDMGDLVNTLGDFFYELYVDEYKTTFYIPVKQSNKFKLNTSLIMAAPYPGFDDTNQMTPINSTYGDDPLFNSSGSYDKTKFSNFPLYPTALREDVVSDYYFPVKINISDAAAGTGFKLTFRECTSNNSYIVGRIPGWYENANFADKVNDVINCTDIPLTRIKKENINTTLSGYNGSSTTLQVSTGSNTYYEETYHIKQSSNGHKRVFTAKIEPIGSGTYPAVEKIIIFKKHNNFPITDIESRATPSNFTCYYQFMPVSGPNNGILNIGVRELNFKTVQTANSHSDNFKKKNWNIYLQTQGVTKLLYTKNSSVNFSKKTNVEVAYNTNMDNITINGGVFQGTVHLLVDVTYPVLGQRFVRKFTFDNCSNVGH